jgi:hypothetical protein
MKNRDLKVQRDPGVQQSISCRVSHSSTIGRKYLTCFLIRELSKLPSRSFHHFGPQEWRDQAHDTSVTWLVVEAEHCQFEITERIFPLKELTEVFVPRCATATYRS